ncbi:uncharacterized protein LOC114531355 [Dendronephthya gigantea]|uniref:uncharacterized protein LOC114531355 n=1 Tax=Dendronephthya gigantea TaxID=151771 RepID=UPI00106CB057|nr:uncharacterized protein LOC114531355 [Dendronephthya gigantea]
MDNLPELVLLEIVKYLSPEECVRLSRTCKRLNQILPRFVRFSGKPFKIKGPSGGHWAPEKYFDGPVLEKKVKGMRASVQWKDQGWGNRKGRLMVKLMRRDSGQNKVIAENNNMFGIAEHKMKSDTCKIVDHPVIKLSEPGDFYSFERNAGGGGGHTLTVKEFSVLLEFAN